MRCQEPVRSPASAWEGKDFLSLRTPNSWRLYILCARPIFRQPGSACWECTQVGFCQWPGRTCDIWAPPGITLQPFWSLTLRPSFQLSDLSKEHAPAVSWGTGQGLSKEVPWHPCAKHSTVFCKVTQHIPVATTAPISSSAARTDWHQGHCNRCFKRSKS